MLRTFLKRIIITCICIFGIATLGSFALAGNNGGSNIFAQDPDVCIGGECPNLSAGTGPEGLLTSVKKFINYALGLLALISLILIIFGGFQMVTAAGDDGQYKKGFTILRQAAVGLAFIALAWIIVRFIFFVIGFIVS